MYTNELRVIFSEPGSYIVKLIIVKLYEYNKT